MQTAVVTPANFLWALLYIRPRSEDSFVHVIPGCVFGQIAGVRGHPWNLCYKRAEYLRVLRSVFYAENIASLPTLPHFHPSQKEGPEPTPHHAPNPLALPLPVPPIPPALCPLFLLMADWSSSPDSQITSRLSPTPSPRSWPSAVGNLFSEHSPPGSPESTASSAALSGGGLVGSGGERRVLFAPYWYFQTLFLSLQLWISCHQILLTTAHHSYSCLSIPLTQSLVSVVGHQFMTPFPAPQQFSLLVVAIYP